jgi:protein involved in polysaccharide export with SLBB domain
VARVSRICVCVVLMALGIAVSGCSSALRLTGIGGFDDEAAAAVPAAANPMSLKMQAGDHINVTVYNEASLSGNYSIDSGGFVTIPRAGKLRAAGLAPSELADLLVRKFRGEYLANPKVTVALI